jgi:hypothetical protein
VTAQGSGGLENDEAGRSVETLYAKSHRGLWPLVAFLALSIWARSGFRFVPAIPASWRNFLGAPPPPSLINAAFALYLVSALVISLMRMAGQVAPGSVFRPLGYLAAFYAFHHISGSLPDNYFAVLIGGVVLLSLEYYRSLQYYRQKIQELTER